MVIEGLVERQPRPSLRQKTSSSGQELAIVAMSESPRENDKHTPRSKARSLVNARSGLNTSKVMIFDSGSWETPRIALERLSWTLMWRIALH
jgi:hypothetical protein